MKTNDFRLKSPMALLLGLALGTSFLAAQQSPVFPLIRAGDGDAVRTLLDAEPQLANATTPNGFTPLMAAVALKNHDLARLLIERGALVRVGDDHLRAPIHFANWNSDRAMVELLLAHGAPVDTRAIGAATPLIHSSLNDNFEMCKFLIEKGADIHIQCNSLTTPLYFAVLNGNLAYADHLLAAGAEVDVPDFLGRPPLTVAVRDGNRAMVEKLVDNGADFRSRDRFLDRSLLHLAAIGGHGEVAGFLLGKGLAINGVDRNGRTPLDYAIRHGHGALAARLRGRGARSGRDEKPGARKAGPHSGEETGAVQVIKMQNGGWGVSTQGAFLVFGYSEIGTAPAGRPLRSGYLGQEALASGKRIYCVDHDVHPPRARYALEGACPLYGMQDEGAGVTFLLNPAHKERYAPLGLKRAFYPKPGEALDLPGCRFLALPSYGNHAGYVLTVDGLTMVWLTGICDPYMVNLRDVSVVGELQRQGIRPDILLVGSPAGIGPEIAHGIRETVLAAEPLDARAVFVLGHEPLERKVREQLRRMGRDTRRIHCAENPGDRFAHAWSGSNGKADR